MNGYSMDHHGEVNTSPAATQGHDSTQERCPRPPICVTSMLPGSYDVASCEFLPSRRRWVACARRSGRRPAGAAWSRCRSVSSPLPTTLLEDQFCGGSRQLVSTASSSQISFELDQLGGDVVAVEADQLANSGPVLLLHVRTVLLCCPAASMNSLPCPSRFPLSEKGIAY